MVFRNRRRADAASFIPSAAAALAVLIFTCHAPADSWMSPTRTTMKSPNGKFVAVLDPVELGARGRAKPHLTVRAADAPGDAAPLWETDLGNEVAPVELMLTNDGRHVVTFDNWHRAGYGDDVVAFYAQDKAGARRVAAYSLEQILPKEQVAQVTTSVSSRWWREHGHRFFDEAGGRTAVCVWLGRLGRWVAWDVATGKPLDVTADAEALRRWNRAGADWAMRELSRDRDVFGATRFLSATKNPGTQAVLEKLLRREDFQTSHHAAEDGEPDRWVAWSPTRKHADRALSAWYGDPRAMEHAGAEYADWDYAHLGAVDATLRLAAAPGPNGGDLYVYLFPESVGEIEWPAAKPVHELSVRAKGRRRPGAEMNVRFEGVAPGRYWLKAAYDRDAPFTNAARGAAAGYRPSPGDVESTERRFIDVKPGETAAYGNLRCTHAVSPVN